MKGIISRTLQVKALYDSMDETMRPIVFRLYDRGAWNEWVLEGENGTRFSLDNRGDWFILYGKDDENECELVFCEDKNGAYVPAEYTVWNSWNEKTYFRKFREI